MHGGAFDDPERLQRRDALPVRRDLPDLVIPVRDGDRLHPFAAKRCEIVTVEHAAGAPGVVRDEPGQERPRRNPGVPPMPADEGSPHARGCATPLLHQGFAPRR